MGGRRVVYFPSCLTRVVGPLPGEGDMDLPAAMRDVLGVAGFAAVYPEGVDALCCGMAFGSKGCTAAAAAAGRAALESLARASDNGRDPIVTDASPCAATLRDSVARAAREGGPSLRVLDFPSFWATEALPSMADPPRRAGTAVLHPTCSLLRAGGLPDLLRVARAHAERVVVPAGAECCGFAGDRGFLVPELTAAATVREAGEVRDLVGAGEAGLFSTCRTCEIGMGRSVGRPYRSIVHLVREGMLGG
jgi:D-lactate dehydrogenase